MTIRCPAQGYFRRLSVAKYAGLDPHSDASIFEMTDLLSARAAAGMPKPEFKELQKALGMVFAPDSCLYDPVLRAHIRPRAAVIWDWMHCLVSSGIVTSEATRFVKVLRDNGVAMRELDLFASRVKGLKGCTRGVVFLLRLWHTRFCGR